MKFAVCIVVACILYTYGIAACSPAKPALSEDQAITIGSELGSFAHELEDCKQQARDAGGDRMIRTFDDCWSRKATH